MLTHPQPMTLFERTLFEADQLFYATFPAAREAACSAALEQNLYDPTSPIDGSTSYDSVQSSDYEQVPDIDSTSSAFSGTTQQLSSYPPALHFDYSRTLHSQQPPTSHHQDHHLYHYPPPVNFTSMSAYLFIFETIDFLGRSRQRCVLSIRSTVLPFISI